MNILEGILPEGKLWRTLVLFPVAHEPGLAWQLARQLARANSGELVAAVFIAPGSSEGTIGQARETLGRVRRSLAEGESAYTLLIESGQQHEALLYIIERGDIDLLLADGDNPEWDSLDQLPAPVMVVRGAAYRAYYEDRHESDQERGTEPAIKSILVPTAGGPNSAVALSLLLPLAPNVRITTLYVVPDYLGENEEAHGEARLRQLAKFTDAGDRVERKVIRADSVVDGLVSEASGPYDLVVLGATRESSLERALFGDVVGSVVRESKTPVVVVREAASAMGSLARNLAWRMQNVIPRLALSERTEVYVRIRRSARPDTDFFVLIGLSSLIAALGLMLSSPAVVIGAMLVAPLMSPMVGAGLAVVMGNTRFLRLAMGAIARGVLLAIFLSLLVGLIRPNQAPTPEILSRTQPTLIDLGVAVFAGLAGAYALAHSEAAAALPGVAISAALVPPLASVGISLATGYFTNALGALLLFSTNLVGIIAAGVAVFVTLGFRPSRAQKEERYIQMRSVRVAMVSLIAITATLGVSTYRLAQESARNTFIREVVARQVNAMPGVEFAELEPPNLAQDEEPLALNITVRSTHLIPHAQVEELRDRIGADIHQQIPPDREVTLTLTVIRVTKLDPAVPPTPTPTPTTTETPTPGPTPTATLTPTPTDTPTPTLIPVLPSATLTPTITATVAPPATETPVPPPPSTDTAPADTATPGPSPTAGAEGTPTPGPTATPGGSATPTGAATPTPGASATAASGRTTTSTPAATTAPSPAASPPSPTQPANETPAPASPTPENATGLLFGRASPAF